MNDQRVRRPLRLPAPAVGDRRAASEGGLKVLPARPVHPLDPAWLAIALFVLLFGPLVPVLGVPALGWVAVEAVRRRFGEVPGGTLIAWTARTALTALFCLSLARLVDDTLVLT